VSPEPIGNWGAREVDNRIHRFLTEVLKSGHRAHLGTTDFRDFGRRPAPDAQTMSLTQPVVTELTSYQTSTAGQQYVHDFFLAWRFTLSISLFL
jgi:hypothetical protein